MPELYQNKKKQEQTLKTGENKQQEFTTKVLSSGLGKDTRIIGREALLMPVPKEAKDKSLTGTVKKFFRIKDDNIRVGDGPGPIPAGEGEEEAVYRQPIIDLTDEERKGNSGELAEEQAEEIRKKLNELDKTIPDFNNLQPGTQRLLFEFKQAFRIGGTPQERSYAVTNMIANTEPFYRIKQDILNEVYLDNEVRLNAKQMRWEKFLDRNPDAELLIRLYEITTVGIYGNNEAMDGERVVEQLDDRFFAKNKSINRTEGGVRYDHSVIEFTQESDRSVTPLFANEPSMADIKQGNLGDCYFISALNAIVEKDPQMIKNIMKDEGKTVLVRFFSPITGKPVHVRVNKTVPVSYETGTNAQGERVETPRIICGARGALWVSMLEKAFAVVRSRIDSSSEDFRKSAFGLGRKGYDALNGGHTKNAFQILTGRKLARRELRGNMSDKKFVDIDTLFYQVHYGEKENFMKGKKEGGLKRTSADWNRHKARAIFGIDIPEGAGDLLEKFRKNRLFDAYEKYLRNYLKSSFDSFQNPDWNIFDMKGNNPAFRSMTNLIFFLDSVDISKMPTINLGHGIDEDRVKRNYLEYFKKSISASGLLINGVNVNGKYSEEEKKIWKELNEALTDKNGKRRAVTAEVTYHDLQFKKGKTAQGAQGEALVQGIASTHGYAITGTTERESIINGKVVKRKFVIVHNPWGENNIRLYDKDTLQPFVNLANKKEDGTPYVTEGTFLMEFSDFCNTFAHYNYEKDDTKAAPSLKEQELEKQKNTRKVEDVRTQYSPAFDMSDEERITSSVKLRDENFELITQMAEAVKASPQFAGYPNVTKLIVEKLAVLGTKEFTVATREQLYSEVVPMLRSIYDELQIIARTADEESKKKRHKVLEQLFGDPMMLSGFAAILVPMTNGNLKLSGKEIILDGTNDSLFESSEDVKKLRRKPDGKIARHEEVFFQKERSDMTHLSLFSAEPSTEDVAQGNVGDCFMLASLNAIIEKDPQLIKDAMKDEGSTVVVRFFKYQTKEPVYVRVKKTIAFSKYTGTQYGEKYTEERKKGAARALWVNLLEKAFVIAREHLNDPMFKQQNMKGFNKIYSGEAAVFINLFTGKQIGLKALLGHHFKNRRYISFEDLAGRVHYGEKNAYMRERNEDGSTRTAHDWNVYKAKKIFGVDIPPKDEKLYKLFKDNTVLEAYEKFMKKHLSENFECLGNDVVRDTGESVVSGLAVGHSYSVHGVREKRVQIGGNTVTQYFVEIMNPWHQNTVRYYDKDTIRPYMNKAQAQPDNNEYDARGIFLVELRDFYESFSRYGVEEEKKD